MKRTKLTHAQHLGLARQIREAKKVLWDSFFNVVQPAFGKSHPASRALFKIITKDFIQLQGALDTEYHKVTSSEQYTKAGHVYYKDPE
jgi:hypothetical protein